MALLHHDDASHRAPHRAPHAAGRRARRAPSLALLLAAAAVPAAAVLTGGCGDRGEGGTVSATVPKAEAQKTAAEAQATLPQSSRHDAARRASGASGPGATR